MAARKNIFLASLTVIFILFSIAVAFDISPYLRGPAVYPPDWRWPYQFTNTLNKLWAPLIVSLVTLIYFRKLFTLKEIIILKREKFFLVGIVLLSFIFQISVLFFSRAGVGVLLERIINPDLNGYFTTATSINNIYLFLHNFTNNVLHYSMHTQGHPPGAVLFFYFINKFFLMTPFLNSLTAFIHPSHSDISQIWKFLLVNEKLGALFSGFFICLLSSLSIFPLYFCTKKLYNLKTALVSSFIYVFIPSVSLFTPLNDVFLSLFTIGTFYYLVSANIEYKKRLYFTSGIIFSFGLFFSLSLLPLLLFYLIFLIINKTKLSNILLFFTGIVMIPVILFVFYQVNVFALFLTLLSGLPPGRKYTTWVFYNIYDFFIFAGIPLLAVFFINFFNVLSTVLKNYRLQTDKVFLSFLIMLLALDVSGSVRGEVARIWLPFYPFLAIFAARYFIKNNFSLKQIMLILVLMSLQLLTMQEFWVTLW